jgi:hypothetical protein
MEKQDVESGHGPGPKRIPHWKLIIDQGFLTPDIIDHHYGGAGTDEDPYVVTWVDQDPRNPFHWSRVQKWTYTISMAVATLSVSFCSSAFSGGMATSTVLSPDLILTVRAQVSKRSSHSFIRVRRW